MTKILEFCRAGGPWPPLAPSLATGLVLVILNMHHVIEILLAIEFANFDPVLQSVGPRLDTYKQVRDNTRVILNTRVHAFGNLSILMQVRR